MIVSISEQRDLRALQALQVSSSHLRYNLYQQFVIRHWRGNRKIVISILGFILSCLEHVRCST